MAQQFNNYKKRLYNEYLEEGKVPAFKDSLEKQRPHWERFLDYKKSTIAKKRSAKNKENAAKKKYHHTMGTGGYRTSVPKWEEAEKDLRAQGLTPATEDWPIRVRNWLLAHGQSMIWKHGS